MAIKVLVVDDSGFFRRRLTQMFGANNQFDIVGFAENGKEAIAQTLALKPDVITMDYEMPVMDGITAVKHIMAQQPTPILMFSSLTYEGARITLDAFEAGAVDFLPKNFEAISRNSAQLRRTLFKKLKAVAESGKKNRNTSAVAQPYVKSTVSESPSVSKINKDSSKPKMAVGEVRSERNLPITDTASISHVKIKKCDSRTCDIILIGASTGGPVALTKVLTKLPASFPLPIVLVQHMPGTFTKAYAERLHSLCRIAVKEAETGDELKPGLALLAPGGMQMMVDKYRRVKIIPGDDRVTYKPSVDITFGSAANVFGGKSLGIILTGMGSDGCEGSRMLKEKGATIWGQDETSCVIYGMPMAVARENLTDEILSLSDIGDRLARDFV